MRILNGSELAGFIKERQAKSVRALRQTDKIFPKLAIVLTVDDPVINTYIRLKKKYGADILIEVEDHAVDLAEVPALITKLNDDESVHGIIVQLPLSDVSKTEEIVNLVAPEKDVDALGADAVFDPATPMAILWLLTGYNVELRGKHILLVGRGKLVGGPLEKMLKNSDLDVEVVGSEVEDLKARGLEADVIITATGVPGLVSADMIKDGAVVVDAGVASENTKTVGDLDPDVYNREDLTISPQKGGVGPLTVCALFDNVIRACRQAVEQTKTAK